MATKPKHREPYPYFVIHRVTPEELRKAEAQVKRKEERQALRERYIKDPNAWWATRKDDPIYMLLVGE
jgi:hypothetical protein